MSNRGLRRHLGNLRIVVGCEDRCSGEGLSGFEIDGGKGLRTLRSGSLGSFGGGNWDELWVGSCRNAGSVAGSDGSWLASA